MLLLQEVHRRRKLPSYHIASNTTGAFQEMLLGIAWARFRLALKSTGTSGYEGLYGLDMALPYAQLELVTSRELKKASSFSESSSSPSSTTDVNCNSGINEIQSPSRTVVVLACTLLVPHFSLGCIRAVD